MASHTTDDVSKFLLSTYSKRSTIDSITQNEESKIAYDYVMMLRNNKFEHMDVYYFKEIDYLKHTTREKI